MGSSSHGNCEIVEAIDEPSTTQYGYYSNGDLRPPIPKKVPSKSLEDDINKLFESVNLRTSKSLDLSDSWRNASKRPMRAIGSHSPGIGFSAPVSLKQSLRGLCISQAAEIAAMKRMSLPASPRISEVGRFSNLYRSVAVEASGSGVPQSAKNTQVESTSSYSEVSRLHRQDSMTTSATESSSSPGFSFEPIINNIERNSCESTSLQFPVSSDSKTVESPSVHEDIAPVPDANMQLAQKISLQKTELVPESSPPHNKSSASKKVECYRSENLPTHVKAANKIAPKVRRKSVPSSSTVKVNKDVKSVRGTSRAVRPIVRKNLVIKKSKKVGPLTDESNKVCQKCQCSMNHAAAGVSKSDPIRADDPEEKKSTPVVTSNLPSKSSDKGEISGSSNSSGFSSSTTSLSVESNSSGTIFGNRPHMSKDVRWGAIERVRKQYGFLGLSHFNLLKKLGSGDIGTVYLAELIGTNCPFAIKVMDNEFLGKRKKLPRAQTEREILRMLDHPFLPTLYAQFTSDNLACLVMEFCPGGDLHVLRQKQPGRYFPEQAARFYVAEILLALEYLHMLGIVYRDLKPENILVREDGHIMLTDFDLSLRCSVSPMLVKSSSLGFEPPRASGPCAGSSCIDPFCSAPSCKVSCFRPRRQHPPTKSKTLNNRSIPQLVAEPTEARSNSFVGTHEYLAPEIIKGEGHGSAVDWWTFGVFLYELLYGKTPFKGSGNEETLDNAVLQSLRFPDTPIVSFQARDLIRGLLVKDPDNRFGTETGAAEIKRHPFFEGLNWALIRCAVPPQIPEMYDDGSSRRVSSEDKGGKFVDNGNGEHLEFELF